MPDTMTDNPEAAIRAGLDQAEPVNAAAVKAKPKGRGGRAGGAIFAVPNARGALPAECPVTPLGVSGPNYHYLDALRQHRVLDANEHSRLRIMSLFQHDSPWLFREYPRVNRSGNVDGYRAEETAEHLMRACAARGVWDVVGRLRGPGAWKGEKNELVLHCGDGICQSREPGDIVGDVPPRTPVYEQPGRFGRYVYAAAAAQPRPAEDPSRASGGPGEQLRALFARWHWARRDLDAQLLVGWVGAALIGGALDWRPMVWVTGDKATGKSSLHQAIKLIIGEEAIRSTSDTTAAGIWQTLGHASLPVAVDELEAAEDNRQAQNVIKLARQASSGSVMFRGGQDHQGAEFTVRSCFLFSSINLPPMLPQDLARMAILELEEIPAGASAPALVPQALGELGRSLRRRLLDHWPRLAETIAQYRAALVQGGHGGRAGDQFGTLLACADVLTADHEPDTDTLAAWAEALSPSSLAENDDNAADHERCLAHLRSAVIELVVEGQRKQMSVGQLVIAARDHLSSSATAASQALELYGLKFWRVYEDGPMKGDWLAVTHSHQGLARLFQGTHWQGRSGASGVWSRSLRRIKGWARPKSTLRFGGVPFKCLLLPMDAVIPAPAP